MSKKPDPEPLPPACRTCNGRPFVMASNGGMKRCSCPRGIYFQQRDAERAKGAV